MKRVILTPNPYRDRNFQTVKKALDEALMADDEGSKAIVDVKLVDYTTIIRRCQQKKRNFLFFYSPGIIYSLI